MSAFYPIELKKPDQEMGISTHHLIRLVVSFEETVLSGNMTHIMRRRIIIIKSLGGSYQLFAVHGHYLHDDM